MRILYFVLSVIMLFALTSCDLSRNNNELPQSIKQTLSACETKDIELAKSKFAPNALVVIDGFDDSFVLLSDYFTGTIIMHKDPNGGPESTKEVDQGYCREDKHWSLDVTTDKEEYRVAIHEVSMDTKNPDNVGIWSIYIIKMEDDTNPAYTYRGDGRYLPGIHIGIKNVLPAISMEESL